MSTAVRNDWIETLPGPAADGPIHDGCGRKRAITWLSPSAPAHLGSVRTRYRRGYCSSQVP